MPADNSTVSQKCMLHTCKNTCTIFSILPKKKTGCFHCVCMFEEYAIRTPFLRNWIFISPQSEELPLVVKLSTAMQSCWKHLLQVWLWPSLGSSCFTGGSRGTDFRFMSMCLFVLPLSHQRRNDSQCKAWAIDGHITSQCIVCLKDSFTKRFRALATLGNATNPKEGIQKGAKAIEAQHPVHLCETACFQIFQVLHVFQLAELRRSPLDCESLWGYQADDVSWVAWPLVCPRNLLGKLGEKTSCHGRFEEMQGGMEEFAESVWWFCRPSTLGLHLNTFQPLCTSEIEGLRIVGRVWCEWWGEQVDISKVGASLAIESQWFKEEIIGFAGQDQIFPGNLKGTLAGESWRPTAGVKSLQRTHHRSVWNHHLALLLEA